MFVIFFRHHNTHRRSMFCVATIITWIRDSPLILNISYTFRPLMLTALLPMSLLALFRYKGSFTRQHHRPQQPNNGAVWLDFDQSQLIGWIYPPHYEYWVLPIPWRQPPTWPCEPVVGWCRWTGSEISLWIRSSIHSMYNNLILWSNTGYWIEYIVSVGGDTFPSVLKFRNRNFKVRYRCKLRSKYKNLFEGTQSLVINPKGPIPSECEKIWRQEGKVQKC